MSVLPRLLTGSAVGALPAALLPSMRATPTLGTGNAGAHAAAIGPFSTWPKADAEKVKLEELGRAVSDPCGVDGEWWVGVD